MLYISHKGPLTHQELQRLRDCREVEQRSAWNLRLVDEAQRRGKFTDAELDSMRRDIRLLGHAVCRNSIRLEARGLKAPSRDWLFNRGNRTAQGCFVTHDRGRPQVLLYAAFGRDYGDISGEEVVRHLEEIGDDTNIDFRFNSPGGNVGEVTKICDALKQRRGETRGLVDGVAASGASTILMHCNPIGIRREARVMIHFCRVTGGLEGPQTAHDLEKALKRVRSVDQEIAQSYMPRWRGTEQELLDAMDDEREFVDEDAVRWGLADYVTETTSIATEADIEAAWNKQAENPANILDRRNFVKFRTEFQRWQIAAKSMPYDGESLLDSIKRRKRVDAEFAISALDLVPRQLRDAAKKCGRTV